MPCAYAELDISFTSSTYLTDTELKGPLNNYFNIGLKLEKYGTFKSISYGVEALVDQFLYNSNQRYIAVPNLFFIYNQSFLNGYSFSINVGRQEGKSYTGIRKNENTKKITLESWSILDEIWDLGIWQSRVNWDYLQTKQQGLTGFFFTIQKKQWLFTVFFSGFFLPDHTPVVDITKGYINSSSRWVMPSQYEFMMFNQRIAAFYWLQKPYLKNVILNDSVATRFRFGSYDNQWFNISYANKPVNQIHFKVDSGFSIHEKSVTNIIHYQSLRHSLISIDFGVTRDILKTIASVTLEMPRKPKVIEGWIVPMLPKALFASYYVELNLKQYDFWVESIQAQFLYTKFVKSVKKIEPNIAEQLELDIKINRFKIYHGFALSAYSKKMNWFKQSVLLGISYWYSIPENGGWLHAVVKWNISPKLRIESQMDILGAENSKKRSFFNTYRQNDRINFKVVYAFN